MPVRPREFDKPSTLADALTLLRRADAVAAPILYGPRLPNAPFADVEAAIDLSGLGLDTIQESAGEIRLGALTSLQALVDSAPVQRVADGLLARSAQACAHRGLRRLATVGGAVMSLSGPPDLWLALLALEAVVTVYGVQSRDVRIAEFSPDASELVTEVRIAPPAGARAALERVARTPRDESLVAVAAVMVVEATVCRHVRLAVGGAGPRPALVRSVENVLVGQRVTAALVAEAAEAVEAVINPTNDFRASADYRREMARVLARRVLQQVSG